MIDLELSILFSLLAVFTVFAVFGYIHIKHFFRNINEESQKRWKLFLHDKLELKHKLISLPSGRIIDVDATLKEETD